MSVGKDICLFYPSRVYQNQTAIYLVTGKGTAFATVPERPISLVLLRDRKRWISCIILHITHEGIRKHAFFMEYYLYNKTLISSQFITFEGILYFISFSKIDSWVLQMDSDTNPSAPCKKKNQLLKSGISNRVPVSIISLASCSSKLHIK